MTVVRVSDLYLPTRARFLISHFGKLFPNERCWGVDYGEDFISFLCQFHDTLISVFHFRSVVHFHLVDTVYPMYVHRYVVQWCCGHVNTGPQYRLIFSNEALSPKVAIWSPKISNITR